MPENHLKTISQTDEELRVANYIVLWGGRDLTGIVYGPNPNGTRGQYFTPETDFESPYTQKGILPVDWEHGKGREIDNAGPGKDEFLGYVDWKTAKQDDTGIWVERVLNRRQKYVKILETLIQEGLIGTSSQSMKGGAKADPDGKITRWALERDTLTVIPMEPRMMTVNAVSALKSLAEVDPTLKALLPQEAGEASEQAKAKDATAAQPVVKEKNIMSDVTLSMEEYKTLLQGQIKAPDEAPPIPAEAEDPAMKALSEKVEALTKLIENAPILKDAGYVAPDSETDHPEVKSFGDFCIAVRNKNTKRLKSVYGSSWEDDEGGRKAAMAESTGPTGGYVVPTQFVQPIMAAAEPFSVLRRAGATRIPMTGKSAEVPVLDIETAPSAGDTAYAAGVVAYWEDEAATLTESEPRFRMLELTAHKLAGYSIASNEVRADAATSIDSLLTTLFGRAVGSKENYAFFRGNGVKKPRGILSSSALISATRSAASTVALADLAQMMSDFMPSSWNTGAWFMNPAIIDQILQLVSNPLAWLESLRAGMTMSLIGLPIYVTGALPALNTAGDILLVDPSYYLIGDRQSLSIAFSEHYKFINDQGTWRFTYRVDGQPWIDNAVTLEDAATTVSPFVALAAG